MDNLITVQITKHAKERYVERIMNKKDKLEIARYITENEDKITNDISKMVTYGQLVYQGKNPRKDKWGSTNQLKIYASNAWIILVNPEKNDVITLFKIDLGLEDDEFNKQYVEKVIEKVKEKQNAVDFVTEDVLETNDNLRISIEENNDKINTYRTYIKQLEEANNGYKAIMDANLIKVTEAENSLAEILEKLVTNNKI